MIFPDIPGFRVERLLGRGGMGVVYLALEEDLRRSVALKVLLPPPVEDPTYRERFLREARTVARLNHTGIIQIHRIGRHRDHYYMAMEYLTSGDLKHWMRETAPAPHQCLAVIRNIALALQHAHSRSIIHRDLKPQNILFRSEKTPVLVDFGIARTLDNESRLTQTGASLGTPHYMSPEQGAGETVDARSDIYSLGVILYEMLTGDVPYRADSHVSVLLRHIRDPLPSLPGSLRPYRGFIERMMAKRPAERVPSCSKLVEMIDHFSATGQTIELHADQQGKIIRSPAAADPVDVRTLIRLDSEEKRHQRRIERIKKRRSARWLIVSLLLVVVLFYLLYISDPGLRATVFEQMEKLAGVWSAWFGG